MQSVQNYLICDDSLFIIYLSIYLSITIFVFCMLSFIVPRFISSFSFSHILSICLNLFNSLQNIQHFLSSVFLYLLSFSSVICWFVFYPSINSSILKHTYELFLSPDVIFRHFFYYRSLTKLSTNISFLLFSNTFFSTSPSPIYQLAPQLVIFEMMFALLYVT